MTVDSYYDDLIRPLFLLPAKLPFTAWTGHIPFLFALFRVLRPSTFVELGVHYGGSLIGAASAARACDADTRIFGIDTWIGDQHSGYYEGDAVYQELNAFLQTTFADVQLIRDTFDAARGRFESASVDILHIDGFHTYESVRHDFDTWREAVAAGGAILFHDIAVRRDEFGVWRLWAEVKQQYPHIEFDHSYGLGVVFPSGVAMLPASLRLLVEQPEYMKTYARLVAQIGDLVPVRFAAAERDQNAAALTDLQKLVDQQKAQLTSSDRQLNEAGNALHEVRVVVEEMRSLVTALNAKSAAADLLTKKQEDIIAGLYSSSSWQLTSPLRYFAHMVRRGVASPWKRHKPGNGD